MRVVSIVLSLSLTATAAAHAADAVGGEAAYYRGIDTFGAGDLAGARRAFLDALSELPAEHPLVAQTQYNLARMAEDQHEACEAEARFGAYLEAERSTDEGAAERVARARRARESAEAACHPPPLPTPQPADPEAAGPPASTGRVDAAGAAGTGPWPWVTGGLGIASAIVGGVFLGLAQRDVDEADDAYARFVDSGRADLDARDAVSTEVDALERDRAIGYVALGVGAALAAASVWLFLGDADSVRVGAAPGGGWVGVTC